MIATLAIGRPLTAREIAKRCPSAAEIHTVSCLLYDLRHEWAIERAPGPGMPRYRLKIAANPSRDAILRLQERDSFGENEPPNTPLLRARILACLRDAARSLSKSEIIAGCEAGRSRHDVPQQLHILVTQREIAATGFGQKRVYWSAPTRQLAIDFEDTIKRPALRVYDLDGGWRLAMGPARPVAETRVFMEGVNADLDAQGHIVALSISRKRLPFTF